MSDDRCSVCDRPECKRPGYDGEHRDAVLLDCENHVHDWRAEELALREQVATMRSALGESDVRLAGVEAERDHYRLALAKAQGVVSAARAYAAADAGLGSLTVGDEEYKRRVNAADATERALLAAVRALPSTAATQTEMRKP